MTSELYSTVYVILQPRLHCERRYTQYSENACVFALNDVQQHKGNMLAHVAAIVNGILLTPLSVSLCSVSLLYQVSINEDLTLCVNAIGLTDVARPPPSSCHR